MKKRQMYFRMITASLLRRRSRMVIALLAIAIGATILSGLLAIYIDVPRQMRQQFRNYGANMIFTATGENIQPQDVSDATAKIPASEIVGVAPYRYETVRVNDRPVMAAATDMAGAKSASPFWKVEGEWPQTDGEVMVGKNVADTYQLRVGSRMTASYMPEDAAEDDLGNDKDFVVTGILDTGGKEEDYIYVNFADLESLTESAKGYDMCELSVSAEAEQLQTYANTISKEVPAVNAKLVKRVTQSETTVLSKLQALVLLVTIVVLLLTMICVATTMTAVVAERRKEIGLRKALGASDQSIIKEFMGEGVVLGAFGGLLGAFLGFGFAQIVSANVFHSSITLMPWLIPVTIVVSVVVTGIACMFPIRSATDVDPALVLKGE
ncbi:MAG: ABC transporter permease [Lachnospiraceae bacterium]|nr:ABC transporter permease [Lachnospiraceae bacterium]